MHHMPEAWAAHSSPLSPHTKDLKITPIRSIEEQMPRYPRIFEELARQGRGNTQEREYLVTDPARIVL